MEKSVPEVTVLATRGSVKIQIKYAAHSRQPFCFDVNSDALEMFVSDQVM